MIFRKCANSILLSLVIKDNHEIIKAHSLDFFQKVDAIQQFIENIVDTGDDQELFISAYVNGHFDLAVVKAQPSLSIDELDTHMLSSLETAKDELAPDDYSHAITFWQSCISKVRHPS